jgi:predicted nucleic acid-binding protein
MNILLDTNICIDLACRADEYPESVKVFAELKKLGAQISISGSCVTDLYYLIAKEVGKKDSLLFLKQFVMNDSQIKSFTQLDFERADELDFKDFEDACIAAVAENNKCDYIITRNGKDLIKSSVTAVSPNKMIDILGKTGKQTEN